MMLKIHYVFKAQSIDEIVTVFYNNQPQKVIEEISKKQAMIKAINNLANIEAFLRRTLSSGVGQYIRLDNETTVQKYLRKNRQEICVEFFHKNIKESLRGQLIHLDNSLNKRERELKLLVNQLKDETSQFYAMQIISKTSKTSFSEFEDIVQIAIILSEPLVDSSRQKPLFYEQIDIPRHIQRLKQASLADCSLSIHVQRHYAEMKELNNIFNRYEKKEKQTFIVQFFTRVEVIDGEICMSFENNLGEQIWERAEDFIKNCCNAELLIIIGIGAYLLEEIQYQKAMILISTVSLEDIKFQQPALYKDNYALTFLEVLYQSIFKRLDLIEAVQIAQKEANNYYYNHLWCCCLHSHYQQCNWKQIVSKIGNQTAHKLFKHNFQEWKGTKFYTITNQLQKMIIGQDDICARDNICCWNRQQISKNQMHQPSNQKAIIWNRKVFQLDQGMNVSLKMNKFTTSLYDKPVLRVRPATIYKIIRFIQLHFISILRATKVTPARRLLSQAFEYVKNRHKYVYMFEILADKQVQIESQIQSFVKKLLENQLFFSENLKIFVSFIEKVDCNSAYERFMKNHKNFLYNLKRTYQTEICLSFIVVTTSVFFESEYPTLHLSQWPSQQQKYYEILHSFNYDSIAPDPKNPQKSHKNLILLKQMIVLGAEASQQEVKQKFQEIRLNSEETFNFLGFLSLFEEEGFYLNKSTSPILEEIFTKQIVDSAIARKLPIDTFVFANCIHFQMSKTCLDYLKIFHQKQTIFMKKILKFYKNLFQIYLQLLDNQKLSSLPVSAKQYLKKQGLFSISVEVDDYTPSKLITKYKQENKTSEKISDVFYNHSNFKPIYHINQFIKIISKNNHNMALEVSSQDDFYQRIEDKIFIWNVAHKIYLVSLILKESFMREVKQLHQAIKILLKEYVEEHPIITLATIQMQILLAEDVNLSIVNKQQSSLLKLLTSCCSYSNEYKLLSEIKPKIDSAGKFLEVFQNCCALLYLIKELCEEKEVVNEFQKLGIVLNIREHIWHSEHLLLIQKKTLFYFNHKKIKQYQTLKNTQKLTQNLQEISYINIGQIRYEFDYVYFKLPEALRQIADLRIVRHYIDVSISETRVDDGLLFSSRQGYSSQLEPIYQYLSLKIDKKTLFKDKRLVVICRARNSFQNGEPYILNRKRYLTIPCLREILKGFSLKSSYFNLTPSTLQNLSSSNIAQILYFVIFADSLDYQNLIIGQDQFVDSFRISAQQIYDYFQKIDIKFIIIVGRNSIKITKKIFEIYEKQKKKSPLIIGLQSSKYSMCDSNIHCYPSKTPQNAIEYVSNQVYLIGMDLITLYIIGKLQKQLRAGSKNYNKSKIDLIVAQSIKSSKQIIQKYIEITDDTFKTFEYRVYSPYEIKINRVQEGVFQDLTSKYYSTSQNNFYHYKYYQNVGRCTEIYKILSALSNKQTLIQIIGDNSTGKTTILHEICWTAQIKNLFQFGISIFDIKTNLQELKMFIGNQKLQQRKGEIRTINKMIAIDNLSEQILIKQQEIFLKLRNKSIAIIFTAVDRKVGEMMRQVLRYQYKTSQFEYCFNMNENQLRDIYGLLLTNVKQLKSKSSQQRLTKEKIIKFNTRVNDMMLSISSLQGSERIKRALKFSKLQNNQREERKQEYRYNFYKVHYDDLISKLKDNQYISVRFS